MTSFGFGTASWVASSACAIARVVVPAIDNAIRVPARDDKLDAKTGHVKVHIAGRVQLQFNVIC
jgi:hypothetical protein